MKTLVELTSATLTALPDGKCDVQPSEKVYIRRDLVEQIGPMNCPGVSVVISKGIHTTVMGNPSQVRDLLFPPSSKISVEDEGS